MSGGRPYFRLVRWDRCGTIDERRDMADGQQAQVASPVSFLGAATQAGPDAWNAPLAETAAGARYDCPVASPNMGDARPFGIVSGAGRETRIAFFKKSTLGGFAWRGHFSDVEASQVLRFGARCTEHGCSHYDGRQCALGDQVDRHLAPVVDQLPACLIRGSCRWFAERGAGVCLRCPQVVKMAMSPRSALDHVAELPQKQPG
jgi:hypothetical protein